MAMNRAIITKSLLSVFLLVIIALSGFVWYSNSQVSQLQNQNNALLNQTNVLLQQNSVLINRTNEFQGQIASLQAQMSALQNQTDLVKITGFSIGGWYNPGGMAILYSFSVNVTNVGINDVNGVVLTVQVMYNGSVHFYDGFHTIDLDNSISQIGTLRAGEERSISGDVYDPLFWQGVPVDYVASVKIGDLVLDERTVSK
jgi:hypothetical protein